MSILHENTKVLGTHQRFMELYAKLYVNHHKTPIFIQLLLAF